MSGLPPVLWLVAAILATVFVTAALTGVPARIGTRLSVAQKLRARRRDALWLAAAARPPGVLVT